MVTVDPHSDVNVFTEGWWYVVRDSLGHITLEFVPVTFGEHVQVYVWVGGVKNESRIVFKLQISHSMQRCQEVPESRVCKEG